jgi:membrane protease YdiL (CAAX protease family)
MQNLVMDDPDTHELEEAEGIGIFEPGHLLEDEVTQNQMLGVLGYTALGMILLVVVTAIMMFPLMMVGLITINLYTGTIYIDPLAMMIMTSAELAFVIPPLYYIKSHGLPKSALGIKNMHSPLDIGLGLLFGLAMLGANVAVSYFVDQATGPPSPGLDGTLVARNWPEMIAWAIVMIGFVGFTEELMFRGFMQRRMEMYLRGRRTANYKWVALGVSSFIFAAVHLDIIGLPTRFILGMFLGFLAQRRKYNLIGPSVAHGINNAAVVFLSSLPYLF